MHKGNAARIERRGITGELTSVGMCAQAIFVNGTLHLYLLSPQFQRILLVFGQVKQLLAGRFLVLVAGNEDTGRGADQDTFAFLFITYKGDVWPGEGEISFAHLSL